MSASHVLRASECFSCIPPYLRVISGQKLSSLQIFFSDQVCGLEGSHVPIWTYTKVLLSCHLDQLHILTYLPVMKFSISQDICAVSSLPQDSFSFYISSCKLSKPLQSLWHQNCCYWDYFNPCSLRFLQKSPKMHWPRVFCLIT